MKLFRYAEVKFNNGNGALLCSKCSIIIATGFDHEDRQYLCGECQPRHRNDPIGPDFFYDNTRS